MTELDLRATESVKMRKIGFCSHRVPRIQMREVTFTEGLLCATQLEEVSTVNW